MSLAFNLFFWDDWLGVAAPAPSPTPTPGSGGGHKHKKAAYEPLDQGFWDVREAYLRSLQNETLDEEPPIAQVSEIPPAPLPQPLNYTALPRYVGERAAAITALRLTTDVASLKAAGARLIEINRAISAAKRQKRLAEWEVGKKIRSAERKKKLQALRQAGEILLKSFNSLYRSRDQ